MIWHHRFAEHFPNVSISILGTDLSADSIAAAHEGVYPHHSIAGLSREWIQKYFEPLFEDALEFDVPELFRPRRPKPGPPQAECKYRLRDDARRGVSFEVQDVQVSMPAGDFDIILSRYAVCLYLPPDERDRVLLAMSTEKLCHGGSLVIGCDDHLPTGIQEQANLEKVCYDASQKSSPFRSPRAVDGLFRRGPVPPLKDGEHPTLRYFLRARGSDADWVLDRERALRSLTQHKMGSGSQAIWQRAVSLGRRTSEGVVDRLTTDSHERRRRAAERAQAAQRSESPAKILVRPSFEAVEAMRSFAARMEADVQRRAEKDAHAAANMPGAPLVRRQRRSKSRCRSSTPSTPRRASSCPRP